LHPRAPVLSHKYFEEIATVEFLPILGCLGETLVQRINGLKESNTIFIGCVGTPKKKKKTHLHQFIIPLSRQASTV
jgi:hypothetical protein